MDISFSAIERQWGEAFGDAERPDLYASNTPDEEGFLPLNDPQDFVTDITNMSHQQLHASGANNQLALRQAQDEFMEISKLIMEISGKDSVKNPQAMKQPEAFEEIKESRLYGYKYEKNKPALLNRAEEEISEREKADVRLYQEPFEQGGFVPNPRQYKTILSNVRDPRNPDGWKPIERDGKLLIPRQQIYRPEYPAAHRNYHREERELARPGTASSMDSLVTPSKPANRQLARTRFGGQKHPSTRDVSEAPSITSTPRGRPPTIPKVNGHSALAHIGRDDSPAKRRKLNSGIQSRQSQSVFRPQHPISRSSALVNSINVPDFLTEPMSPGALRRRKWTTEELVEAVKHDHTWLTDDPSQQEHWKEKILNSQYPVRTFSMFKKWSFWKQENRDKRPRNRKDGNGDGKGGKTSTEPVELAQKEEEELKDAVEDDLAEMQLQNGIDTPDAEEVDDTVKEATVPVVDEVQLKSLQDIERKEGSVEAHLEAAITKQIAGELLPSIEQVDDLKVEVLEEDPEDTIVAKTDSRPTTPIRALAKSRTKMAPAARRLLRSAKRETR